MGDLEQFVSAQRAQGKSDTEIESGLINSGWDANRVKSVLSSTQIAVSTPVMAETPKNRLNASQVFLALGIALVLAAAFVIVQSGWEQLSQLARFLIIAVPNFALFVIGQLTAKQENLVHVRDGTVTTGILLLPVTVGTFLFQFGIISQLEPLLFLTALLISLPAFIYFDIHNRTAPSAVLTLINLFAIASFGIIYLELLEPGSTLAWLVVGVAMLTVARYALQQSDLRHQRPYQLASAFIIGVSIPTLISYVTNNYLYPTPAEISYYPYETISYQVDYAALVFSITSGLSLLILASLYNKLFPVISRLEITIQRLLHIIALILSSYFVLPLLGNGDVLGLIIALVLSGTFILLGLYLGIRLFFAGGLLIFFISVVTFLIQQAELNALLTMLVLGFGAIVVSIFLARSKAAAKNLYSADTATKFGVISDEQAALIQTGNPGTGTGRRVVWAIILIIIIWYFARYLFYSYIGGV